MKHYDISGPLTMHDVPEHSAKRLNKVFDGSLTLTFVRNVSDRPVFRKPTDREIEDGVYGVGDYVLTTDADGIM